MHLLAWAVCDVDGALSEEEHVGMWSRGQRLRSGTTQLPLRWVLAGGCWATGGGLIMSQGQVIFGETFNPLTLVVGIGIFALGFAVKPT